MIQELLYTSHEGKGLRAGGGGGFCTVLSTEGMASNLATALERLSGYKHPFDIHDPRSARNPVNFRHTIIRVGGITYHVLSRVADLRREHTGRSNKLAHHLALPQGELPPGGPSWLLAHPGFARCDWDGQVRLVPARRTDDLPAGELPVSVCRSWQAAAGDAGWAGFVADHLLQQPGQPISVIFTQQIEALPLINEVFSLIPQARRWQVSFSTYFTSLPAGTSCDLRFVLDQTPEADALRRDHRQTLVDLAERLPAAQDTELVIAARRGHWTHPAPAPAQRSRKPSPSSKRHNILPAAPEEFDLLPEDGSHGSSAGELTPTPPVPLPPRERPAEKSRDSIVSAAAPRRSSLVPKLLIGGLASAALMMLILVTAVIGFMVGKNTPEVTTTEPQPPTIESRGETAETVTEQSSPPAAEPAPGGEPAEESRGKRETDINVQEQEASSNPGSESDQRPKKNSPREPGGAPPELREEPTEDEPAPRQLGGDSEREPRTGTTGPVLAHPTFDLPNLTGRGTGPQPDSSDIVREYELRVPPKRPVILDVKGLHHLGGATRLTFDPTTNELRLNGHQEEFLNRPIARFAVAGDSLKFTWLKSHADQLGRLDPIYTRLARGLRWCLLEIDNGQQRYLARLSQPFSPKEKVELGADPLDLEELLACALPTRVLRLTTSVKLTGKANAAYRVQSTLPNVHDIKLLKETGSGSTEWTPLLRVSLSLGNRAQLKAIWERPVISEFGDEREFDYEPLTRDKGGSRNPPPPEIIQRKDLEGLLRYLDRNPPEVEIRLTAKHNEATVRILQRQLASLRMVIPD